jgi:hypothetical protein
VASKPVVNSDPATLYQNPDRNLAMELVRATEAAAIRAVPFIGRGDKLAADGAAVDAMRTFLGTVNFDGVVVIARRITPRCCLTANTLATETDPHATSRWIPSTELP